VSGGQTSVAVPAGGTGVGALAVGTTHACQLPGTVQFAAARSFVEPDAANQAALRELVAFAASGNAHSELLLVAHTDTTGSPSVNNPLSERRAEAVHGLLTGDTAAWERLFTTESWSTPELTGMVVATGEADPTNPAAVAAAVARYQGPADAPARAGLYQRYFEALLGQAGSPSISFVARNPPHFGCGKEHPLRGSSASPSRDPALPAITGDFRPNRRTEAFFFTQVSAPMTCADYPGWTLSCTPATPTPPAVDWFVSSALGSDAAGHGTSRADPFRTITFAIDHIQGLGRSARDVIHVMDGTYREQVRLAPDIELVADDGAAPVVTAPAPVAEGTVTCINVSNVLLQGLTVRGTPGVGPAGIVIRDSQNITVTGCPVTGCSASRGGGILVQDSNLVTISGCIVTDNYADRGGGIALVRSTEVTVEKCGVERNTGGTIATAVRAVALDAAARLPPEIAVFEFVAGDAHGGGVYLEDCDDVKLLDGVIRENQAILFGGGIAVDNQPGFTGSVLIEGNEITCNQVSHGDLAPLNTPVGCQRADMGDPVRDRLAEEVPVIGGTIANMAVPYLHGVGVESGLGGGVALRNVTASTRLVDNDIGASGQANRARRGGGVECFTGAYPFLERNRIESNLSSDDGGGVAIDQFDPFLPSDPALPPGQVPRFLGFTRAAMVPRQPIQLVNNQITSNRTLEDGGGLYATGAAIVEISGEQTVIADNRANENGGGIRVSYAVQLTVRDATIRANHANADAFERQGGGGLAARNSHVELENCRFTNNVVHAFAGGGVFVNSSFEGGFDEGGFIENVHGQFDHIMEDPLDFNFHARQLIVRDCRGSGNRATGASGAGGFLYAVRVPGNDGGIEPIEVTIEGASTGIGENTSEYERDDNTAGRHQKRGNVVVELSGERDALGLPIDLVTIVGDVKAIPTGIALSTPAPDNRAVVVIHELRGPGSRPDDPDPALGPNAPAFPYANRPP
jgi:Right handed beta helix region